MFVDYVLDLRRLKSYRAIKFSVKKNFIVSSNFLRQSKLDRAITELAKKKNVMSSMGQAVDSSFNMMHSRSRMRTESRYNVALQRTFVDWRRLSVFQMFDKTLTTPSKQTLKKLTMWNKKCYKGNNNNLIWKMKMVKVCHNNDPSTQAKVSLRPWLRV